MTAFEKYAPDLLAVPEITIIPLVEVVDVQKIIDATNDIMKINNGKTVIINLKSVVGAFHLQSAVYNALLRENDHNMKTSSFNSEVAFRLASTSNIQVTQEKFHIYNNNNDIIDINEIAIIHVHATTTTTTTNDIDTMTLTCRS